REKLLDQCACRFACIAIANAGLIASANLDQHHRRAVPGKRAVRLGSICRDCEDGNSRLLDGNDGAHALTCEDSRSGARVVRRAIAVRCPSEASPDSEKLVVSGRRPIDEEIVGSLLGPDFNNLFLHLRFYWLGYWRRIFAGLFNVLVARRPQLEKRLSFFVEPLAVGVVEDRLPYDAIYLLRTEVVLVVEAMDHLHHIVARQSWILDVRHLVSAGIHHGLAVDDEPMLLREVVKLGSGIGVRNRDLNSFAIQRLGEVDGIADCLPGLAW